MALTGSHMVQGTAASQEDLYLEGGPDLYFADRRGSYNYDPDADNFYWGLSGTAAYPVYKIGCYENFSFMDNITLNDVRCDTVGVVASIQKRNYLEVKFDLKSFFPFSQLGKMLKGGGAVVNNTTQAASKFGLGEINNSRFLRMFFPLLYDHELDSFVSVTLHKTQFVEGWDWKWTYGNSHMINLTMRAFADTTRDASQRFASIVRVDPNVLGP